MVKEKEINNIKVKTELNTNDKLVTISYVVNVGSYNENEDNLGITHLIEHLVFKGTDTKNSKEINKFIENLGGSMNAYTSYEETKFYCTVPSEYWKEALDFLNDLIFYNTIPEDEFEVEKNVVMNELMMYEDDPSSVCQNNLFKMVFNKNINRQIIGGTVDTVKNITRDDVINFINENYTNNNLTIIITGNTNTEENEIYNYINQIVPDLYNGNVKYDDYYEFNDEQFDVKTYKKDIYKSILSWCIVGPNMESEDYFPFYIVTNILSGNASSILYSKIREELGLVYSIRMWIYEFKDYSLATGSTSLDKDEIENVKNRITDEINSLKVNQKILDSNKKYLIGTLLMDLEKTIDRNDFLTKNSLESEEFINKINMVTLNDIERVITTYFKNNIYYSSLISE